MSACLHLEFLCTMGFPELKTEISFDFYDGSEFICAGH